MVLMAMMLIGLGEAIVFLFLSHQLRLIMRAAREVKQANEHIQMTMCEADKVARAKIERAEAIMGYAYREMQKLDEEHPEMW